MLFWQKWKQFFSEASLNVFCPFFILQIVDLSLLVKQEMTAKSNPISHVISASYIHYNTHAEVQVHTGHAVTQVTETDCDHLSIFLFTR